MHPEEQQQRLIGRFLPIEDVQERLALVVDAVRKRPPLPAEERLDHYLVPGCSSRVWLIPRLEEGRCRFRIDADSTLVRGLAALVCDVYDGALPAEAAAFEAGILDALHLVDHLSPTRRHGLEQIQNAIRAYARAAAGNSSNDAD